MSVKVYVCGEVADGVKAVCSGTCELPEAGCGARFVPWLDTVPLAEENPEYILISSSLDLDQGEP